MSFHEHVFIEIENLSRKVAMDEKSSKKPRMEELETTIEVSLKWNNSTYTLLLDPEDTIVILRHKIQIETEVLPVI